MSLYLSALVEDHFGEVERFCIEDLAGIFYRCLEHEEPRDETDWLTAERWVDGRLKTTKFTEKYLYFSVYEEFRKLDKNLREISSYSSSRLNDIEFFNIKEYITSKMDRDEFEKIINKLSLEDRR